MKAKINFRFTNLHNESGYLRKEFGSIKEAVDWCKHTLAPAQSRFRTFSVTITPADVSKFSVDTRAKHTHLYRKLGDWCEPYFEF